MMSIPCDEAFRLARAGYDRLTPTEQTILQFLSILFEPVNRANLSRYLRSAEIRDSDGRFLSASALDTLLDNMASMNLVDKKLVAFGQTTYYACHASIAFHATRAAMDSGRFHPMVAVVQRERPLFPYSFSKSMVSFECGLRDLRLALFARDSAQANTLVQACQTQFSTRMSETLPLVTLCASPFDADWFQDLPISIQIMAIEQIVVYRLQEFEDVSALLSLLQGWIGRSEGEHDPLFQKLICTIMLFRGDLEQGQAILEQDFDAEGRDSLWGWLHFLRGEHEKAIQSYEQRLRGARKIVDKRRIVLGTMSGIFFLLALLKSGTPAHRVRVSEFMVMAGKSPAIPIPSVFACIGATLLAQQNKMDDAKSLVTQVVDSVPCWVQMFHAVGRHWLDGDFARKQGSGLPDLFEKAKKHGFKWPAMEIATLMAAMDPDATEVAEYAAQVQRETGMQSVVTVVVREESWERALNALIDMGVGNRGKSTAKLRAESRLIWLIGQSGHVITSIQPLEQTRSAKGIWSKGRPVALKRLVRNTGKLDYLTAQDRKICSYITGYSDYYSGVYYQFSWSKAMLAMVGHPLVFWVDAPGASVEIVKSEPELLVEQKGGQLSIQFSSPVGEGDVLAIRDHPGRCTLVEITAEHRKIAHILGSKGLRVPAKVKGQVMEAMRAVSPLVTIHSGIGGDLGDVENIPADPKPHIHLLPYGEGLKINMVVSPFSGQGPTFGPGSGGKTIIAEIAGKRGQTHRDLREEAKQAREVVAACPTLGAKGEAWEWVLEDPESCLELLLELQALSEKVVIAWPEGEKMRVSQPLAMDRLRVQIQKDQDWFAVTGTLSVDADNLLDMTRLLDLARNRASRFIPLGEGKFLALTDLFRRQLAELDGFSEKSPQGQRFHPLASPVFREMLAEAGEVKTDKHWQTHVKRIDKAQTLDPKVPSTLRAELRDYQVEGFRWLARLAAWGVGGCLADDMGLGKTLQILTLLLHRAQEGPSLVVAPTSVGLNWMGEMDRFAPTLCGILFGSSPRQEALDSLKPFDVLVCSYGLLQTEMEKLTGVHWNVIVLDEAQAIKNRLTKRSQTAMALDGAFRIIATGTPVENHLGEVWNLFQFINPGLLGSLERFNERFASPIERSGDKGAQKRLRKLLQPFLLRRTKSQVLEELPPRTEIVLNVEMSAEEMAFYEALRRKAIEQIESLDGPMEQKRFQILAEIMRLRRACCNSRLVLPDSPIESAKLALFWDVVEELRENRHKALVFSQFVDHLAILRTLLDEKGVVYHYLDGSTPQKKRQSSIDAFQAGEGDLFLISLKAGGVGINLTAADYVIHMDPWWNPAVEDQASDRAHRIGQTRPVTIYRLITQGTIEGKIVELHRHKRDLADGLLEDGDVSGKLSVEDLLNMIRSRG
ncbi:MAG: DEAD/DEAH box helicase [Magnetococcales bacterium]|nr:DEAD/DEAH box helicase [Magnetococcales bacterium]